MGACIYNGVIFNFIYNSKGNPWKKVEPRDWRRYDVFN